MTTVRGVTCLFRNVEELRRKARLTMRNAADLTGVSKRAYVTWATEGGANIMSTRLEALQRAQCLLELGFEQGQLPVEGHDRRPETTALRARVVKELLATPPY